MGDFDWKGTLKAVAPGIATMLGGPLAGVAVKAIGEAFDMDEPTPAKIEDALKSGKLSMEQFAALKQKELEINLKLEELGVKREDIAAADRNSARQANVAGGVQNKLFVLSLLLLSVTLGAEIWVLLDGYPRNVPEVVVGRILGLLDAIALNVMAYWYGTTVWSGQKTEMLAQSQPAR